MGRFATGALSGAIGTLALDAATYADIAVRGRAPSSVPADTVGATVAHVGLSLGDDDETAAHRRTGIGALLGYGTGIAIGTLYGTIRPAARRFRLPVAGLTLGATAMIAANAGAVMAGTTDPRQWSVEEWLDDIVPHLCFGLAAVGAFDVLDRRTSRGRR
jgi:hypothetical protein